LLTLSGHFNSGDQIALNLQMGTGNKTITYTVSTPTSLAIRDGLIRAIIDQAGSNYTVNTIGNSTNTINLTATAANTGFTSNISITSFGRPKISSMVATTAAANVNQINRLTLGGSYKTGDVISVNLTKGLTSLTCNYTVAGTSADAIYAGIATAINGTDSLKDSFLAEYNVGTGAIRN
jgi:hypothetical protein